jgi:hypothetical protein
LAILAAGLPSTVPFTIVAISDAVSVNRPQI